jgi:hypothetical protein
MYDKVIEHIKSTTSSLTESWAKEMKASEYLEHYKTLNDEELHRRGEAVLLNLIKWMESGAQSEQTGSYFEDVGAERLQEGFSLTEVYYAIHLVKETLLKAILTDESYKNLMDSETNVELVAAIANYFDLGNFFVVRGFHHEMMNRLESTGKFSKDELQKLMGQGSLDEEELDDDEFIWRHVY